MVLINRVLAGPLDRDLLALISYRFATTSQFKPIRMLTDPPPGGSPDLHPSWPSDRAESGQPSSQVRLIFIMVFTLLLIFEVRDWWAQRRSPLTGLNFVGDLCPCAACCPASRAA